MMTDCRNPVESANRGKGVLSNCASGCETLGTVESGIVTLNDSVMIWLAALAAPGAVAIHTVAISATPIAGMVCRSQSNLGRPLNPISGGVPFVQQPQSPISAWSIATLFVQS